MALLSHKAEEFLNRSTFLPFRAVDTNGSNLLTRRILR